MKCGNNIQLSSKHRTPLLFTFNLTEKGPSPPRFISITPFAAAQEIYHHHHHHRQLYYLHRVSFTAFLLVPFHSVLYLVLYLVRCQMIYKIKHALTSGATHWKKNRAFRSTLDDGCVPQFQNDALVYLLFRCCDLNFFLHFILFRKWPNFARNAIFCLNQETALLRWPILVSFAKQRKSYWNWPILPHSRWCATPNHNKPAIHRGRDLIFMHWFTRTNQMFLMLYFLLRRTFFSLDKREAALFSSGSPFVTGPFV